MSRRESRFAALPAVFARRTLPARVVVREIVLMRKRANPTSVLNQKGMMDVGSAHSFPVTSASLHPCE